METSYFTNHIQNSKKHQDYWENPAFIEYKSLSEPLLFHDLPLYQLLQHAWASTHRTTLQSILKLQKIVVSIIVVSSARSHTLSLFQKFGILDIYQINHLQIVQFVYGSSNKTFSSLFHNLISPNKQFHNFPTRKAHQLRPPSQFNISYRGDMEFTSFSF